MSKKIIREETETTHSSVADIQQPSHTRTKLHTKIIKYN